MGGGGKPEEQNLVPAYSMVPPCIMFLGRGEWSGVGPSRGFFAARLGAANGGVFILGVVRGVA